MCSLTLLFSLWKRGSGSRIMLRYWFFQLLVLHVRRSLLQTHFARFIRKDARDFKQKKTLRLILDISWKTLLGKTRIKTIFRSPRSSVVMTNFCLWLLGFEWWGKIGGDLKNLFMTSSSLHRQSSQYYSISLSDEYVSSKKNKLRARGRLHLCPERVRASVSQVSKK